MNRPDYCPIGGEPCQALCDERCSIIANRATKYPETETTLPHQWTPHNPAHPYVLKFIGCGHGVLFTDQCRDCEIVGLQDEYRRAVKTIQRVRNELRRLGSPLPGMVAP